MGNLIVAAVPTVILLLVNIFIFRTKWDNKIKYPIGIISLILVIYLFYLAFRGRLFVVF